MADLQSDQIIHGKYRVVQQVGKGGMGAVYAAVNMATGSRAALKVLTLDVHSHPELIVRFQNEARAANQSGHPGVVPVYDAGQMEDGTPYLVMPFLDGESLSARIRRALMSPQRVLGMSGLWMLGDIASALAATHERGIIHRDLKPANVMLVSDPSTLTGERAMVLDFGVAKLCSDELTRKGAMLGTPMYMALEQFRDAAAVDGKADVFSLGCIGYQLLTGRLPHPGPTHFEIMGQRMEQTIVQLAQIAPAVPSQVAKLIMAMLEKNPASRPTMPTVELEVRAALGLPPLRLTSRQASVFSQSITADALDQAQETAGPSGYALRSTDPESDARTPSLSLPVPAVDAGVTPSAERVAGEVSPPGIAIPPDVPQSLSHVATAPVPMPILTAGPKALTIGAVPSQQGPAQVSSPSALTIAERRARYKLYLAGALLFVSVSLSAWWVVRMGSQQARPSHAMTTTASIAPSTKPNVVAAEPKNVAPVPDSVPTPPSTIEPAAQARSEPTPVAVKEPPRPPRCESVTAKCVSSPLNIKADQKEEIAASFQQALVPVCGGEAFVFTWKSGQLKLRRSPKGFTADKQNLLKLSLTGNLRSPELLGPVTIRCDRRTP